MGKSGKLTLKQLIERDRRARDVAEDREKAAEAKKGSATAAERQKIVTALVERVWSQRGLPCVQTGAYGTLVRYTLSGPLGVEEDLAACSGFVAFPEGYDQCRLVLTQAGKSAPNDTYLELSMRERSYGDGGGGKDTVDQKVAVVNTLVSFASRLEALYPWMSKHPILVEAREALRSKAAQELREVEALLLAHLKELEEKVQELDQRLHSLPSPLVALARAMQEEEKT